jgi:thiamine biosynthesis lipoprotein
VTVIHLEAAVADAWVTALTVLGPQEGYALAEREGLAALFVTHADSGFVSRATAAYKTRRMAEDQ